MLWMQIFRKHVVMTEEHKPHFRKLWNIEGVACCFMQPRRNDLDMNQHVNNVTYIGWMLEVHNSQIHVHFAKHYGNQIPLLSNKMKYKHEEETLWHN